jgi:hypothetical protein
MPAAADTTAAVRPAKRARKRADAPAAPSGTPTAAKATPAAKQPAARKAVPVKKAAKAAKATRAAPATAWVEPSGDVCPQTHPVKAKLSSKLFHLPGMFAYDRTKPDRCYANEAAAEADGLTKAKR